MSSLKQMVGQRFGKLVVLNRVANNDHKQTQWYCICDCGEYTTVTGFKLRNGHTSSCGCIQEIGIVKHGKARTSIYKTLVSMRQRCGNPNDAGYPLYGGRGIKVCDRWQSFENFYADMGDRPSPEYSIDRIDSDGDYCPENCRWATDEQQNGNRRVSHTYEYKGQQTNVSVIARDMGITPSALLFRIKRFGVEKALSVERLRKKRKQ